MKQLRPSFVLDLRPGDIWKVSQMSKKMSRVRKWLDADGAGFRVSTLGLALLAAGILAVGIPYAAAGNHETSVTSVSGAHSGALSGEHSTSSNLDKKFKGQLPLTELTADGAI